MKIYHFIFVGLFFHVVGEGVVNLSKKAESVTDRESYIDFRLRLLGEQGIILPLIICMCQTSIYILYYLSE